MVLKRVGEKVANILVNGTQEASYTQNADSADYDVSVSDNAQTVTLSFVSSKSVSEFGQMQFSDDQTVRGNGLEVGYEVGRVRVTAELNSGGDTNIQVSEAGGGSLVYLNTATGTHSTGWLNRPAAGWGEIRSQSRDAGTNQMTHQIDMEVTVSSGFSIDGVTQQ